MPPIWLFIFVGLGLLAMGVLIAGKSFAEDLQLRQRAEAASADALIDAKRQSDLEIGIGRSFFDPLGIIF
jgi:hypothetical protein